MCAGCEVPDRQRKRVPTVTSAPSCVSCCASGELLHWEKQRRRSRPAACAVKNGRALLTAPGGNRPRGLPALRTRNAPQHPSRLASLLRAAGAVNRSAIRLEEPSIAGLPPRQTDPLDRFARFPLSELLRMIGCFALCGARPEAPRLWTPANFWLQSNRQQLFHHVSDCSE